MLMEDGLKVFKADGSFTLECGTTYEEIHLGYHTYGSLNEDRNNVVWIFHALTANSDAIDWWHGLVGTDKIFDPAHYFIICVNVPGSCYGSLSPLDMKPGSNDPYFHDFTFFTTRDIIKSFQLLKEVLDIKKIKIGIGGSMGGQQLLEWAIEEPALFENIIPMATNAQHSAWGIAFNASQRMAIKADESWNNDTVSAGLEGMKVARSIALLSYRHYETYHVSQSHQETDIIDHFKSESYQQYQGEKLARRFNAHSYYLLSKTMDSHNVGRGRGSVIAALQKIEANALVIGIDTDILFPVSEQSFIAGHVKYGQLEIIQSLYGHDGFLLEFEKIELIIKRFLNKKI